MERRRSDHESSAPPSATPKARSTQPTDPPPCPEITISIEPPPVPFQNIRRRVATVKPANDPLSDLCDRMQVVSGDDAQNENQDRSEITEFDQRAIVGVGPQKLFVQVVD